MCGRHRWLIAFVVLSLATVITIQIYKHAEVGYRPSFFVIVPLVLASGAAAVMMFKEL